MGSGKYFLRAFCIYSTIRFPLSKSAKLNKPFMYHSAINKAFFFQNNPKVLDPSCKKDLDYKMDLDFGDWF